MLGLTDNALGVKLRLAATASRPRTPPPTARWSLTLGWTDRVRMQPGRVCSDTLWSLCRGTPTPSRLPQALTASPLGQPSADLAL